MHGITQLRGLMHYWKWKRKKEECRPLCMALHNSED